jgi:rhodanese-related sulfurtransferase
MQIFSPVPVETGKPAGGGPSSPGAGGAAADRAAGPMGIDLQRAQQLFDSGTGIFIDAREPGPFAAGHIAGALNLPWEGYEEHLAVLEILPQEGTIVTYCDGGECELSVQLADFLAQQGFQQVRVFFGGWEEWQASGYPTESGEAAGVP